MRKDWGLPTKGSSARKTRLFFLFGVADPAIAVLRTGGARRNKQWHKIRVHTPTAVSYVDFLITGRQNNSSLRVHIHSLCEYVCSVKLMFT